MQLNHLNLSVPDITTARALFETHFDFTADDIRPNDTLSILKGADGFVLVLMNERMNQHGNHSYPDAFHIGFFLADEAAVIAKYDELKAAGLNLTQEPQRIRKTLASTSTSKT